MKSLCKTKAKEELTEEQRSHVNKTIEGIMKAPLAIFLSLVQAFIGPSFELLTCKIQNSRECWGSLRCSLWTQTSE